jgi:ketosteroid isomerase-like protein
MSSAADCMQTIEAAMRAKDVDGALALMTDDVVFFYSNQTMHVGKAAIGRALAENFSGIEDDTHRTEDITWLLQSESSAACVYHFRWTGLMDGNAVGGKGRGTSLFRREPDGWKLAHEHLSQGPYRSGR